MRKHVRASLIGAVAIIGGIVIAACGTSSSSSSTSAAGAPGGTITIASGTPPLSADQGLDFTTQGNELYSAINTPLLTFVRGVQGTAGSAIVPALAKSMPKISDGGKTLTFQLRPGLKYSNGQPV